MSYVDVFAGSPVQPAEVSYSSFTLVSDAQLYWPWGDSSTGAAVVGRITEVSPSAGGHSVILPAATEASVGQDVLVLNTGSASLTLKSFGGATLTTISPGEAKYAYITVNTTAAGTWGILGFGTATNVADSGLLAGKGLVAIGATLNSEWPVVSRTSSYSVTSVDRANVIVFDGGSATASLSTATTLGTDFVFSIKNAGSGTITVDPAGAETIDGLSTISLSPDESCVIVCDGVSKFFTVGRGRATSFNFTQLVKSVTGGSVTLSAAEAANKLLQFNGTLGSNQTVVLPATVNIYYVFNNTSGAFTLTLKTVTGSGVAIPSGRAIIWCDASEVYNAVTVVPSTAVLFIDGSAAAPSISFASDDDTGVFKYGTNTVGVAAGAATRVRISATEQTMEVPIAFANAADATTTRENLGAITLAQSLLYSMVFS